MSAAPAPGATLSLAKQLISLRSVTPEDGGCQDVIAARLEACGFAIERVPSGKVVNLWARVLAAVPNSRLLLKSAQLNEPRLWEDTFRRFAAHGIRAERLMLERPDTFEGYLLAHNRMDIALDQAPPPPSWPEGIVVRTFRRGEDEPAVFAAVTEAFRDHWGDDEEPFDLWLYDKIERKFGFNPRGN